MKTKKNFLKKLTAGILGFVMTLGVGAAGYAASAKETRAATDYSNKQFEKFTGDLVAGDYLFVVDEGKKVFNGLDAASDYFTATPSNDKITYADGMAVIKIESMTGGWSLKINSGSNNNGKYIYGKSGSNSIQFGSSAVASTVDNSSGAYTFTNNSTSFRFNNASGNYRFRFYKTSTTGATYLVPNLYKLAASKTLSSIAVSSDHRTFTVGDTFTKETVTATYSDASTADVTNSATFSSPDMSSAGTKTINVSYTEGGTTKSTSYTITVSAPVTNYTLSFNGNGSTGGSVSQIVQDSNVFTLPANGFTAPSHKKFDGWGSSTSSASKVGGAGDTYLMSSGHSQTLYALWANTGYELTFDGNGGSGSQSAIYKDNSNVFTLPACTFTAPSRKVFDGWGISASSKVGNAGESYTITGGDGTSVKLYALWRDTGYTLNFLANTGGGTQSSIYQTESEFTLPACTFTAPTDKYFAGWGTSASSSTPMQPGTKYTVSCSDGGSESLYAIWNDIQYTNIPVGTYEVNISYSGSDAVTNASYTVKADTESAYYRKATAEYTNVSRNYSNQYTWTSTSSRMVFDTHSNAIVTDIVIEYYNNNRVNVFPGMESVTTIDPTGSSNAAITYSGINDTSFRLVGQGSYNTSLKSITVHLEVAQPIDHLALAANTPTKYKIGSSYSKPTVYAYYEGVQEPVDVTEQAVASTPTMTTAGEKNVTITYRGETVSHIFTVYTINSFSFEGSVSGIRNQAWDDSELVIKANWAGDLGTETLDSSTYALTFNPTTAEKGTTSVSAHVNYMNGLVSDASKDISNIPATVENVLIDNLTHSLTGVTSSSYTSWSNKKDSSGTNSVVYAGKTARNNYSGHYSIQFKNTDNTGIVSTSNPDDLQISKVEISFYSQTTTGRTVSVYGSNTAFTSPSDLYSIPSGSPIVNIGEIVYGSSTTVTFPTATPYKYIGLRSSDGAVYIDNIKITYKEADSLKSELIINNLQTNFTSGDNFTLGSTAVVKADYTQTGQVTVTTGLTYVLNTDPATTPEAITTSRVFTHADNGKKITVTYTDSNNATATKTYAISVAYAPVTSISLNITETSISLSGSLTLIATINDEDYDPTSTISWSSNNQSVATVSGGVVTPQGVGEATITASCGSGSASCVVTVSNDPVVSLNRSSIIGNSGDSSVTLTATPQNYPEDAVLTYSWSVEDEGIVELSSLNTASTVVSLVAGGETTIRVTVSDGNPTHTKYAECTVNLVQSEVTDISLTSSVQTGIIYDGTYNNTLILSPTVTTVGNATKVINWSIESGSSAVEISSQQTTDAAITVTGKEGGNDVTAVIRATSNYTPTVYEEFTVTVKEEKVSSVSWTKRNEGGSTPRQYIEGSKLSDVIDTTKWVMSVSWASGMPDSATWGTGENDIHVGLYSGTSDTYKSGDTYTPVTGKEALDGNYTFKAEDNNKYLLASYKGKLCNVYATDQISIISFSQNDLNKVSTDLTLTYAYKDNGVQKSRDAGEPGYHFEKVTSLTGIDATSSYVIVCEEDSSDKTQELTEFSTTTTIYGIGTEIQGVENISGTMQFTFDLQGTSGSNYKIANGSNYLTCSETGDTNDLKLTSSGTIYTVSFDENGNVNFEYISVNKGTNVSRRLAYNNQNPRFAGYKQTSLDAETTGYANEQYSRIQLYKKVSDTPPAPQRFTDVDFRFKLYVNGLDSFINENSYFTDNYGIKLDYLDDKDAVTKSMYFSAKDKKAYKADGTSKTLNYQGTLSSGYFILNLGDQVLTDMAKAGAKFRITPFVCHGTMSEGVGSCVMRYSEFNAWYSTFSLKSVVEHYYNDSKYGKAQDVQELYAILFGSNPEQGGN